MASGNFWREDSSATTRSGRRIEVTVRDPRGATLDAAALVAELSGGGLKGPADVGLSQVGLGRYQGTLPPNALAADDEAGGAGGAGVGGAGGALRVSVFSLAEGARRLCGRTSLKRLPGAELTRLGADRVLLGRIAANTGGRLVESPGELAREVERISAESAAGAVRPIGALLAAAALAIFLLELLARALGRGRIRTPAR